MRVAVIAALVLGACGLIGFIIFNLQRDENEITTDSGLKYIELAFGAGDEAKPGDRVRVRYTGSLADGKKFDTSVGKPPFEFILGAGEVIKGWDEGVTGMKPGGKRKLIIPSKLAYGEKGFGDGLIPPDAELTFEVELLKILPVRKPADTSNARFITTDSGLRYADLAEGQGDPARQGDTVVVRYTGWLQKNGKQFDSSWDDDRPIEVKLGAGKVIKGWEEGLVGMKFGGKRQLIIPPELGYGDTGQGPIPPKAVLIFDVDIMEVKKGR